MTARDDLLAALLVERYTNPWWVTPSEVAADNAWRRSLSNSTPEYEDNDLLYARRRRELVEAWDEHVKEESA